MTIIQDAGAGRCRAGCCRLGPWAVAAWTLALSLTATLYAKAELTEAGKDGGRLEAADTNVVRREGESPVRHRFLAVDEGTHTLVYVDEYDPSRNWTVATGYVMDMQLLANERVLLNVGDGFREYDVGTGKLLREVKGNGGKSYSVCRTEAGRTILLGDNLEGQKGACLVVYDPAGRVVERKVFDGLSMLRHLRPTPEGTYLLTAIGQVVEVNSRWEVVWRAEVAGNLFEAVRLPNGNVLCSSGPGGRFLKELNRQGAVVHEICDGGLAEGSFTGFRVLPNGHIMVANWLGHGPDHNGTVLVEFDGDGRIVWRYGRPHASFVEVLVLDQAAGDEPRE